LAIGQGIGWIDDDAVVVLDVFEKKTRAIPQRLIAECQRRLRLYDQAVRSAA
jgi:phage-related protein